MRRRVFRVSVTRMCRAPTSSSDCSRCTVGPPTISCGRPAFPLNQLKAISRRGALPRRRLRFRTVPLGRSALLAFERAEAETRARQTTYLGIEHLLLCILAEESGEAT